PARLLSPLPSCADLQPPPAGPGPLFPPVPAVGARPGPGEAAARGRVGRPRLERDERVVDHEASRFVADPPHDAPDNAGVVRTIDARDAETDGAGNRVAIRERLFHHLVQDLLDLQLADGLEVRAAAARFREDLA